MGNQAQNLKKLYVDKNIKHILTHNDSKMGEYDLFRFLDNSKLLYLKKIMNPDEYEEFTSDWEQFQKYIFEKHENICQFVFFEVNEYNQDNFDMIFEFGNYINTQLQTEQLIWRFIEDILEGLIFLQIQGLHYPLLRKRYSVYVTKSNNFKLLNPYCFPDFLKDAISIYFNPEVQIHVKKQHSENCLNRNVKEFGIMLLALIANIEELVIYQSPIEIKNILNFIKSKYSVKLYDFLSYCIHTRQKMNFYDLKNYLNQYQQKQFDQENQKKLQAFTTQSPKVKASVEEKKSSTIKKVLGQKDNNFNDTFGQFNPTGSKQSQTQQSMKQQQNQVSVQSNIPQHQMQNQVQQQQSNQQTQKVAPKNHNKKIKRVVVKWMKDQMCHKEFIEYEDGTLEEKDPDKNVVDKVTQNYYKKNNVKMPTQEQQDQITKQKQEIEKQQQLQQQHNQKIQQKQQQQQQQQLQQQQHQQQQYEQQQYDQQQFQQQQVSVSQQQPQTYQNQPQQQVQVFDDEGKYLIPRNDVSDYDINKFKQFPKKKLEYWISLLTGDLGDKPKKILTSKIIVFEGCYDELKIIVNNNLKSRPSMYHQVEEIYNSRHFRPSHTVHHQ